MSNQLVITSGAKVRSLEGVITGSTGVLNSLPINAANGIPQLDSSGKILVSQLPNSVMEYKGTWNANTNTPTLADGTGNQGDVYLCNVAGTTNFGSGPIAFVVGDQVIYSGTIWQRASGATGTVTSVAVTESGDALSITGSPITTSGTINIGFAGTSAQYVAGNGSLVTFPTLTGYVPYTGATSDVNLGLFDLKTAKVWLYDVPNDGYGSMELTDGVLHFEDADGHSMVTMEDGYLTIANASTIRALLNVSALSANRDYAFPNASGTLALTSDLNSYVPTSRTISTTSPLQGGGDLSANRTLSITQATTSTNGYLSSTDWNTFNSKGSGSVTSVALSAPTGFSVTGSPITTTGTLALAFATGYSLPTNASQTNWDTAYTNRITSLTTTGNSGSATLVSNTLNVPTYTLAGLGGVPTSRTLTINGVGYDLSADRSWTINSMVYPSAGIAVSTGTAWGTSITDNSSNWNTAYSLRITSATSPLSITSNVISISQASGSTNGYLSSTDWTTFNSKQGTITLTTTGTSGAATLVGSTLNIPQYQAAGTYVTSVTGTSPIVSSGGTTPAISITQATTSTSGYLSSTDWNTFNGKQNALTNPITGTGVSGQVAYWNGTTTHAGSNNLKFDGTNLTVGNPTSALAQLHVYNASAAATILLQTNSTTDYSEIAVRNDSSTATSYFRQYSTAATGSDFGISRAGLALFFSNYATNFAIGTRNGGALILGTADTERMRISAAGLVGIGTTSPAYTLDVNNTTLGQIRMGTAAGAQPYWLIGRDNVTTGNFIIKDETSQKLSITNTGAATFSSSVTQPYSIFTGVTPAYPTSGQGIIDGNGGNLRLFSYADILFYTNGSQKATITSGGTLAVNTTYGSSTYKLVTKVGTDRNIAFGIQGGDASIECFNDAVNASAPLRIYGVPFYLPTVATDTTSSLSNVVIDATTGRLYRSTTSSQRYKENIKNWNGSGLETILALTPKTFKYKEEYYNKTNNDFLGLIAEEVAAVSPYLADYENEDRTGQVENVRYANIVVPLIKAIQELKAEIDELKNK